MKQVTTVKEEITDFDLEKVPYYFSSVSLSRYGILSAICVCDGFSVNNLSEYGEKLPIINLYTVEKLEESESENNITFIGKVISSDIYNLLLNKEELAEYSHVHISEIKLSKDGSSLLVGCVVFPDTISEITKIRTYLLNFNIVDDVVQAVEYENDILNDRRQPIKTLLSESNDITNYKKVTSLECSIEGHVVSIILGNDTHVCLRAKLNQIDYFTPILIDYIYVEELRNVTKVINADNERTLYSSISSSGNRIAIGNRDNRNAVKNNSVIATVGNVTFLVYNHFKKQWEVEDTYFERNLYIQNIGEYVSLNNNGDKLITTGKYIDQQGNNKNVIYVLARDSKGKWKRFLREIVEEKITGVEISADGNKALVYILNNYGTPRVSKGLKFFFREGKDMYHINLTDESGNLVFNESDKKFDYLFNSIFSLNSLSSFIVVKGRIINEENNSEVIDEKYTVIKNTISFTD